LAPCQRAPLWSDRFQELESSAAQQCSWSPNRGCHCLTVEVLYSGDMGLYKLPHSPNKPVTHPAFNAVLFKASLISIAPFQVNKKALKAVQYSAYGGRPYHQLTYAEKRYGGVGGFYTHQKYDTDPLGTVAPPHHPSTCAPHFSSLPRHSNIRSIRIYIHTYIVRLETL